MKKIGVIRLGLAIAITSIMMSQETSATTSAPRTEQATLPKDTMSTQTGSMRVQYLAICADAEKNHPDVFRNIEEISGTCFGSNIAKEENGRVCIGKVINIGETEPQTIVLKACGLLYQLSNTKAQRGLEAIKEQLAALQSKLDAMKHELDATRHHNVNLQALIESLMAELRQMQDMQTKIIDLEARLAAVPDQV